MEDKLNLGDYSDNKGNNRNNSRPHCSVSNLLLYSEQDNQLNRLAAYLVNSLSKQEAYSELLETSSQSDNQRWDKLVWAKINSSLEDCLDNRLHNKQEGYSAQQTRINLKEWGFWVNKLKQLHSANNLNKLLCSDKHLNNLLKEVYLDKLLFREVYSVAKLLNLRSNSLE
jgi:hypothetical protein